MPESNDVEADLEPGPIRWVTGAIYTALIAANLWLAYDWWRDTPQGAAVIEKCRQRIEAAKAKAENCEGCAHRKEWLRKQVNRVHWQAEEIVAEASETAEPGEPS